MVQGPPLRQVPCTNIASGFKVNRELGRWWILHAHELDFAVSCVAAGP